MSNKKNGNSGNKTRSLIIFLGIIALLVAGGYLYINDYFEPVSTNNYVEVDSTKIKAQQAKSDSDFVRAATSSEDTTMKVVYSSSPLKGNVAYVLDEEAGKSVKRVYTGRRINIAVTGLDNRLGQRSNHADANHVVSILVDSGTVEIISVPRDTPADAGMPDTSNQNKLTIVRAGKGREAYHKELAIIAGVDKIHYFVEGSFSQVMGLIEFLGIKDSKSTLQVLRSRVGLGGDDYQRCYNQGQFVRQMVLKHFNKFKGLTGEVLIRGGLILLETNLTTTILKDIIDKLESKGFAKSPESIRVKVRPPMFSKFKIYDFGDEAVIQSLKGKIENFNESYLSDSTKSTQPNPARILRNALNKACADTAKRPKNVVNNLSVYFNQHAWLQVPDLAERDQIRNQFAVMLSTAYTKQKQTDKAKQVWVIIKTEQELFMNRLK